MFSLSIRAALEAIAEYDDAPWAQFSFYPCPVGAPTPMGCLSDPCPPKEPGCNHADFTECCIKDKFEDCLVHELGCFTNATEAECSFDTRLKLGKFVGCFEGGHVEEDHCPQARRIAPLQPALPNISMQSRHAILTQLPLPRLLNI